MKNPVILIIAAALLFSTSVSAPGAGPLPASPGAPGSCPLGGVIVPASPERITILIREKGLVNLGQKNGIIKGDIGSVTADESGAPEAVFAQCAVTTSGYRSSICEVIKARREVDPGYSICFDPVTSTDTSIFPLAISMLSQLVDPYPPFKHLNVCIYGIFNDGNAVTGFSDVIERELEHVFSQKKRIGLVDRSALKDLVFYADSEGEIMKVVRGNMREAGIDVLLVGKYRVSGRFIELTCRAVHGEGQDGGMSFAIPLEEKYAGPLAAVILAGRETTQVETLGCALTVKAMPYKVRKDEKAELALRESAGNALVEQAVAKVDFNIISPVQVKVLVDGEEGAPRGKEGQVFTLTKGVHRVLVSFKRGYYFNGSLLYTSTREVTKEAVLDLGTADNLVMEVRLDPLFQREAIGINVYQRVERERQLIVPIQKAQSEKNIEVFKD
jgi:hypothetical protein